MNKTAIKNFAIWARNKLISDITYKAGLLGITDREIKSPLPQSTKEVQFFDIGTKEPYSISGEEIKQREKLVELIINKASQSDYATAYKTVVEEVAYTWFNRLIAVRFMEVNDYLPSRIRVLSSESLAKVEPDLVTTPFDTDLEFTPFEKDRIVQLTLETKLDELFRVLFIKQCNALNAILPNLFERTSDFTELLLNVSFTDKDGVVYHLVHDITEDDFNISKEGQIEIIGWLYQYYNTEPKDETFALLKKNVKITKERIPAATQLFTPDWIVRYMVENSLGRLWLEGHPNDALKSEWKYYLEEVDQEEDVQIQLDVIREEYKTIKPESIKVIDPCMGSGHILVYAFDVLMQIYQSAGYSQRDASRSIIENNIFGLDIDKRAYQLAYFAVMMKARQYDRRFLNGKTDCHVYSIQESNRVNRSQLVYFGAKMSDMERNTAILQIQGLLDRYTDAMEYGSIISVENYDWNLLRRFISNIDVGEQMSMDTIGLVETTDGLSMLVEIAAAMAQKYDVVLTNPPYMGSGGMGEKLTKYVQSEFPDSKNDLYSVFIEHCQIMLKPNRFCAMITQHSWMFLTTFEKLRSKVLFNSISSMIHLGARAFEEISGEVVQTVAFILRSSTILSYEAKFARLVDGNYKEKEKIYLQHKNIFIQKQETYKAIPGCTYMYWASKKTFSLFSGKKIGDLFDVKSGLSTGDNELYVRNWYEINSAKLSVFSHSQNSGWVPYNKGGGIRKWYGINICIVNWGTDGDKIKNSGKAVFRNPSFYFREGITWSGIASSGGTFRYCPEGYLFDSNKGPMIFNRKDNLKYLLGLLNSKIAQKIITLLNPTISLQIGDIVNIPFLLTTDTEIDEIVDENILISKKDWDSYELSWDFKKHPFCDEEKTIEIAFKRWDLITESLFINLKSNEEELNRRFINIYNMQDELSFEVEDKAVTIRRANVSNDIRSFISYAVGCMFGRYSLDYDGLAYAGGQWNNAKYETFIPDKDNIILMTDEEYFETDIVGGFVAFVKRVYSAETLEENLDFIAKALANKGNSSREVIRNYFVKDFFKDHCKIYQKRPIYWLFDSGKAEGFKALIYMNRYDENTIGNLRVDYLHRMQRVYDSEISRMQDTIENSTNAREITAAEKRKEKLNKQLKETKDYDEKIAHLALARIYIDLDDGVVVNYEKIQTGTDGKKLEVLAKI